MDEWIARCAEALQLPADVDLETVLDVARVAAHAVQRPAAPVTTYLLGMAVAGGADIRTAAAQISALAEHWEQP